MFESAVKAYLKAHRFHHIDLRTAMFDMDGVLFDSMKNHAWSWNQAMRRYSFHLDEEEVYMHEGRTGASTINSVSLRERGHLATEQEIHDIYACKSNFFNSRPAPQPMVGALTLLQQVKASGVQPMVVTGSGQKTLLDRLQSGFPNIFTPGLIVTAFDVKRGKPDPEPYLMGLQKSGAQAYQAIVVENAPLGIQAGVAADVFTIAVNTGPLPDSILFDAGANIIFPSMQALSDSWSALYQCFSKVNE